MTQSFRGKNQNINLLNGMLLLDIIYPNNALPTRQALQVLAADTSRPPAGSRREGHPPGYEQNRGHALPPSEDLQLLHGEPSCVPSALGQADTG